jgi:hypothetical protein
MGVVGMSRVQRQISTAVCRDDLQVRKLIEDAGENHHRQSDGGLHRLADDVAEIVGGQPEAERRAQWMDENRNIEIRNLCPERDCADLRVVAAPQR